jgi:hypothetical protein
LHSKVAVASGDEKLTEAVVLFVGEDGDEVMEVSGAVRSTVKVVEAGVASVLPAVSFARTSIVCEPAESPV